MLLSAQLGSIDPTLKGSFLSAPDLIMENRGRVWRGWRVQGGRRGREGGHGAWRVGAGRDREVCLWGEKGLLL